MLLDVSVFSPEKIIFEGKARSVTLPGEQGVFEVLPFHKRIISRLISGIMVIDDEEFPIRRGIIFVEKNKVTVIAEEAA